MAVFELDADGRITQWREACDLKSMMDQIKAAAQNASFGKAEELNHAVVAARGVATVDGDGLAADEGRVG